MFQVLLPFWRAAPFMPHKPDFCLDSFACDKKGSQLALGSL